MMCSPNVLMFSGFPVYCISPLLDVSAFRLCSGWHSMAPEAEAKASMVSALSRLA